MAKSALCIMLLFIIACKPFASEARTHPYSSTDQIHRKTNNASTAGVNPASAAAALLPSGDESCPSLGTDCTEQRPCSLDVRFMDCPKIKSVSCSCGTCVYICDRGN
ncbi:hypothetical protein LINPERPRIM_LOCUS4326 [Linum perenne]